MPVGQVRDSLIAAREKPRPGLDQGRPCRGWAPARAVKSFTLVLCLLLAAIYGAIWTFYPWRPLAELDIPGWIVDFADQVDLMMTRRNPPIVILGSSLTLAAPRRLARPNVYQEELSKASGQALSVSCMAVPGAIASDQDFILTELLAHHKKPSLIIYTYAPRDFMDNTIEGKISTTPMRRVLTFINRRGSFFPRALSWGALTQCWENHSAFIDLVRRHVLRTVRTYVCRISGHPDTLWAAGLGKSAAEPIKQESQATEGQGPGGATASGGNQRADETAPARARALAQDLELYERRYNPINAARVDEQYHHVEELLSLGRANGIQIELIGMPVSPANLKLLKPGVYQDMDRRLQQLASKYGATLSDLNQDPLHKFGQNEYLDSVHLSTVGARLFVPLFVDTVVQSPSFKKAFAAKAL